MTLSIKQWHGSIPCDCCGKRTEGFSVIVFEHTNKAVMLCDSCMKDLQTQPGQISGCLPTCPGNDGTKCGCGYMQGKITSDLQNTVKELTELVRHMWIHDGYERNGYRQMSSEERKLYDRIVGADEDETERTDDE